MAEHRSAAASLYPHLPSADPGPRGQHKQPRLADALYPSLAPQSPAPKRRLTREEVFDWSNVDPRYARLVGLVPKGANK